MAFEFIRQALDKRRDEHLLRELTVVESANGALMQVGKEHYLNFSSNDYLGQRHDPVVLQAQLQGTIDFGAGSGASPLVTGHTQAHQDLQDYLAQQLGYEAVLLFSSGYAANQSLCQALLSQNVSVFADKLMHASFMEGAKSHCQAFKRFRHNDLHHLADLIEGQGGDKIIVTEGVFSMDGDQAPLVELVAFAEHHNAWLMVDDAHGFGVLGSAGLGSLQQHGLTSEQVPIFMGTFGKAIGTSGAFVAASQDVIDYLINFAKHYIYSTAMPASQAVATLASIQSLQDGQKQTLLRQRIAQFRQLCDVHGIALMPSETAIQPVRINDPKQCLAISEKLRALGLWVTAMRYPTVPKGQDRLRITLSASHQPKDIEALVDGMVLVGLAKQSKEPVYD